MNPPSSQGTYAETLEYLFSQLPMFQRVGPKAFRKDLTNMQAFSALLGHPENRFPSIHIAGTNGKGSTAHLISALLQAHGFKTGLYTSPHYRDFRERIKIDGHLIPESAVVEFVEANRKSVDQLRPSFFEWSVALAFQYFADEAVDIAVIETGLGGRLDSTNIITPLLSVITNISYDHMNFLGDTLEKIAFEKAGIIKNQVPVVIAEWEEETQPVFERVALERKAPLYYAPDQLQVNLLRDHADNSVFEVSRGGKLWLPELAVEVHGGYQSKNLTGALAALQVLEKETGFVQLSDERIRTGLKNLKGLTNFIGRWQWLGKDPGILADSAHNLAGVREAMAQVSRLPFNNLHMVLGMVGDKDMTKVLALFPPTATYYFSCPNIPRGMPAARLQELAAQFNLKGDTYTSISEALKVAKGAAQPNDLIYVGGSTFVVAEVI